MRYIKGGAIAEDPWVLITGAEPVPPDMPAIVSADWLLDAGSGCVKDRTAPLGVFWPNDRPVTELEPVLPYLQLVALEFPSFRDGRAYTQARQLREELGFKGELRATGDVLRDQFLFMVRAGFDAFEVKKVHDAENFEVALKEFSNLYQPASDHASLVLQARLRAKPRIS
jgi:uncharacterized protein (DUF934 family)